MQAGISINLFLPAIKIFYGGYFGPAQSLFFPLSGTILSNIPLTSWLTSS